MSPQNITYLIAQILESKSQIFALGHSCDTEVEPGAIILSLHVRCCITGDPNVEVPSLVAPLGLGHVATTELAAKHDLAIRDLPASPLGE